MSPPPKAEVPGRLRRPDWRPNSVSSVVPEDDPHYVAPYDTMGDPSAAFHKLKRVVRGLPRIEVTTDEDDFFEFIARSRVFRFPDHCQVALIGDQLHLFMGAKYGIRDFGVNRARAEYLRERLRT